MEYTLILPFLDGSESFVLGFEIGQLWEKISHKQPMRRYLVHRANVAQIKLLCIGFGYDFLIADFDGDCEDSNDTWAMLTVHYTPLALRPCERQISQN